MALVINLGTGNVQDGSREHSEKNIKAFIEDLGVDGVKYEFLKEESDGRHSYRLFKDDQEHVVDMPAIPLDKVRSDDLLRIPRLYIDDSSWWWFYALGVLFNEDE